MLFALMGTDRPDSLETRKRVRPEHLARIAALRDAGRLVVAGPHPRVDSPEIGPAGVAGSLIVAEFATRADAEEWFRADPYCIHGVFTETRVLPFIQVMP